MDPDRTDLAAPGADWLCFDSLSLSGTVVLEDRLQRPLQWAATIHDDHKPHRHIHAIAIVPKRLTVQDFQRMRSTATAAALEQLRHLDLAREAARERNQQQTVSLGLELAL